MKDRQRRFGWFYSAESDRIWNPRRGGAGPIIAHRDGETEQRYIARHRRKVAEGKSEAFRNK